MVIYKIKDWDIIYENNRTREMKNMSWLPLPIKLPGDGYTLIMSKKNGPAIFGAFIAVLELASKCSPRGTLVRGAGIPHDPATMSRLSRINTAVIEEMLEVCTRECKWLEIIEIDLPAEIPQEGAGIPHDPAEKCRSRTVHNITEHNTTIQDRGEAFSGTFNDFVEMRRKIRKPLTDKGQVLVIKKLDEIAPNDYLMQIAIMEQSIANSWQGIFPLKENKQSRSFGRQDVSNESINAILSMKLE